MNRSDLQKLSYTRVREAKALFAAGEYGGAYYLAGYAVECALKACFAKGVQRFDFPDKGRSDKVFNHDFKALASLAKVRDDLDVTIKSNPAFASCWSTANQWSEESRYKLDLTKRDAEQILDAIMRRKDGVLPWIKQRW